MNFSIVRYILGCVFFFEAIFLSLPCIVAIIYREKTGFAFLAILIFCLIAGLILIIRKPNNKVFFAKEGFVTVSLSWILISVIGSLPFVINGEIPSFTGALFETVSGFTTTGASIIPNVESLSYCSLFWRSFTHWIGGMGVLVFILAVLPIAGGYNMHLMRAESPGPNVGKLVPSIRKTAMILYIIYICLTVLQVILLLLGRMPLFDALTTSFGTAGTGGFGIKSDSLMGYSNYLQTVTTVFMIVFGINFNVFYLILIKRFKNALKCEELRTYLCIIIAAILLITINIYDKFENLYQAFHHAAFQVASIITTTGFATADFNMWPSFSKAILVTLMFIGACAGSTGGGMKVSRIIILFKTFKREIQHFIHPRSVKVIRLEGKIIDTEIIRNTSMFFVTYIFIFAISVLLICFDNFSLETNFSAVAATINNVGPGLDIVGPMGNFSEFGIFSKYILIFDMLAGRLEIFPMLLLFNPSLWKHS